MKKVIGLENLLIILPEEENLCRGYPKRKKNTFILLKREIYPQMNLISYIFIKINFIVCLKGPKNTIKIIYLMSVFIIVNDIFKNAEFGVTVAHLSSCSLAKSHSAFRYCILKDNSRIKIFFTN